MALRVSTQLLRKKLRNIFFSGGEEYIEADRTTDILFNVRAESNSIYCTNLSWVPFLKLPKCEPQNHHVIRTRMILFEPNTRNSLRSRKLSFFVEGRTQMTSIDLKINHTLLSSLNFCILTYSSSYIIIKYNLVSISVCFNFCMLLHLWLLFLL